MGFSPSNPSVKLKTNTKELIGMTTLTETVNADFYLSWHHLLFSQQKVTSHETYQHFAQLGFAHKVWPL